MRDEFYSLQVISVRNEFQPTTPKSADFPKGKNQEENPDEENDCIAGVEHQAPRCKWSVDSTFFFFNLIDFNSLSLELLALTSWNSISIS